MNNKIQSLSSLDVFLLALIDSGVTTSYAMREQAGISVGASRPALQRLQNLGLVEHGKTEARNKLVFRLTNRGRGAKKTELSHLMAEYQVNPPSDLESIVRIAAIAAFSGNSSAVRALLSRAAETCRRRAEEVDPVKIETDFSVAARYRFMTALCTAAQLRAVSALLRDMGRISRNPDSERIQSGIQSAVRS